MGTLSNEILSFYTGLKLPPGIPSDVEVLDPYEDHEYYKDFYLKYYSDENPRTALFGINPGRLGGGLTGVPFTDPIKLAEKCGISNELSGRPELSSTFIYEVIDAFGGPCEFYSRFYFSALSPLGYTKNGKNLNYYDITGWKGIFKDWCVDMIRRQLHFLNTKKAFCIGTGTNYTFLVELNEQYGLFDKIITLPHPRWVMQYRLRTKDMYLQEYLEKLS